MREVETIKLLTTPFLDTDIERATPEADAELKRRGWPGGCVSIVRFLLQFSLWTNSFIWEEWSLGWFDVFFGYALTALLLSIICLMLSVVFGSIALKIGAWLIGYVLLFAAYTGIKLYFVRNDNA